MFLFPYDASTCSLTGYNRLETQSSHGAQAPFNEFDTTALHIFIQQAFPGALLLEEHQVCVGGGGGGDFTCALL